MRVSFGTLSLVLVVTAYTPCASAAEHVKEGQQVEQQRHQVDIPQSDAATALNRLAEQTDSILLFPYQDAKSRQANQIKGFYSLAEALDIVLAGTGLQGGLSEKGVIKISLIDHSQPQEGEEDQMNRKKGFFALLSAIFTAAGATQVVANEAQEAGPKEIEEVTVSASRIKSSSFESPTPVTVLGDELIKDRGVTNIADLINEVPSLNPVQTPSTTLTSRGNGINGIDIRGLGTNRNLVMVNGRRHVPTNEFGEVDLNVIPSALIKNVDIVKGGASAAWGSDAISGVVNIIYDKDFEGMKAEVQYGQSGESDAEETRLSFAFGSGFDDDRGHVLLSFDKVDNKGIPRASARGWNNRHPGFLRNPAGSPAGTPTFRIADNVSLYLASPNGVTLDVFRPNPMDPDNPIPVPELSNLEFLPGGGVQPRTLGEVGGSLMVGGAGSFLQDNSTIVVPVERTNFLTAIDYEITDSLRVFFEGTYSESESLGALIDSFSLPVSIASGNPFLPASVQADMTANGLSSLSLFRTNSEFGPISSDSKSENQRYVFGLEGDFGNSWSWEAYYQYGQAKFTNIQINNVITANLAEAVDAVDAGGGNIVCASGNPSCVPINLFGVGSPSQAAIDYVTGESFSETTLEQDVFSLTFSGELAEGWAGPISTSFGVEYREEELDRKVDAISDASGFLITNAQPLNGSYDVKEAFVEFAIPLISGKKFAESLDLNLAARGTDYSTSGFVTTWKSGLTYEPTDELLLRTTISRDIRAPAIGEAFLEELLLFGNIINPDTGNTDFAQVVTGGNSDLKEEEADAKSVGIVYSPSWLEGFQISADWYEIEIQDAISQLGAQDIVDRCDQGETSLCGQITRNASMDILRVDSTLLNLGTFEVEGVDFEARYITPVGDGELTLKLLSSYVATKLASPTGLNPQDLVGELQPGTAGAESGVPEWKANFSAAYSLDNFGVFSQIRYIGSGKYSNQFGPEQLSSSDNRIDAEWYMDFSARYLISSGDAEWEVFAGMNNVFDREPPAVPLNFISPTPTNPAFYDVIGRYMYAGVRANF